MARQRIDQARKAEALRLRHADGLSYRQIEKRTGIPYGTVAEIVRRENAPSKPPPQAEKLSSEIGDEIAELLTLKVEQDKKRNRLQARSAATPEDRINQLRIEAAKGDPDALRELQQHNDEERKLEETAKTITAVEGRLLTLERELEQAKKDELRVERRRLAEQRLAKAKRTDDFFKAAEQEAREWSELDLKIYSLTADLHESVGPTPRKKLYAALAGRFRPLVGPNFLDRPSLDASLEQSSLRFVPEGTKVEDKN